jgi:hypothetical protein
MIVENARPFAISLPNPHSSGCGSSGEAQEPEASTRLSILVRKYTNI